MTINERVRELRKNYLNLTMADFGKALGVGKSAISDIESGRNGVSNQMFNSICTIYHVSESWLRDGDGEPIVEATRNERIESFIGDILRDEPSGRKARLINALASLDDHGWDVLYQIALQFLDEQEREERENRPLGTPEGVAEAEAAYEKHYGIVSGTGPSASSITDGTQKDA